MKSLKKFTIEELLRSEMPVLEKVTLTEKSELDLIIMVLELTI